MFKQNRFLAPENEGRGGGNSAPETDHEETAKPLTHEAVHAAISDRFKRFESKLDGRFSKFDTFEQKLAKLDQLDALFEKLQATPAEAPKKEADEAKQARLEAEKLRKRLDAMEAERAAERARLSQQEERAELQRALTSAGVTDARQQRAAMALLYTEEKRVARDAEGRIVFKGTDQYGDPVDLALEDGIKAWAATEDAKGFLPPKEVRGSGSKPSLARAGQPKASQSKREQVAEAQNTIYEQLKNAFGGGGNGQ